jgi:Cysteine-rich domain
MAADKSAEGFDYARHYREHREAERLQVSRDEMTWLQRYRPPDQPAEVVLSFGCGMQTVPHLMLVLMPLLERLGVDFVATAGQQFCCGKPYQVSGKGRTGDRVAATSIRRTASWSPSVSVQCCGSCFIEFTRHVGDQRERAGSAPYEVVHITRFLLDTLKRLGDETPWRRPIPSRVLLHAEGAEVHPSKAVQRDDVIETLGLIPGVEYAGLVADPTLGAPCANKPGGGWVSVLNDLSPREYEQVLAELEAQAQAVDAQMILTHHHKCHREWSKFSSRRLPVVYYPALIAEALGVAVLDRFQMLWQLGDPAKVLAATRKNWESWGISEESARESITKFFDPAYAAAIQRCPCEGTCSVTSSSMAGAAAAAAPCSVTGHLAELAAE